ncbi:MAG: AAA family ATPase [Methyloprofundus sp.]|nr:AAA family ATPase [Methyloprofundus sp.]
MDSAVMIKSVKIEQLFDIFDYNFKYSKNENVLIITGPNGFGKTQILNILFNLFNRNFHFFQKLVFKKITVYLSNNCSVEISKYNENEREYVICSFFDNKKKIEIFKYASNSSSKLIRNIERYFPIDRVDEESWINHNTGNILSLDEVISKYSDNFPDEFKKNSLNIQTKKANNILASINVHLIQEQRLFKKVPFKEQSNYREERDQTVMIETIQTCSDELCSLIAKCTQKSYAISQSLDSSYPNRLISEKKKVSKKEYEEKFSNLKEKLDKLRKNGLYENTQKTLDYSEDDAKALLVYLNDLEEKLGVFDELLEKLELFTSILNERRFTFKTININRENGFYFKTENGTELKLNQLSSGEQHEVVLLYELIFKTKPGILVLIDEPEISLHITWQKEFLDDLLRIIKIQNFQVLIATHSPFIINDRWDLTYNLEKSDDQ